MGMWNPLFSILYFVIKQRIAQQNDIVRWGVLFLASSQAVCWPVRMLQSLPSPPGALTLLRSPHLSTCPLTSTWPCSPHLNYLYNLQHRCQTLTCCLIIFGLKCVLEMALQYIVNTPLILQIPECFVGASIYRLISNNACFLSGHLLKTLLNKGWADLAISAQHGSILSLVCGFVPVFNFVEPVLVFISQVIIPAVLCSGFVCLPTWGLGPPAWDIRTLIPSVRMQWTSYMTPVGFLCLPTPWIHCSLRTEPLCHVNLSVSYILEYIFLVQTF